MRYLAAILPLFLLAGTVGGPVSLTGGAKGIAPRLDNHTAGDPCKLHLFTARSLADDCDAASQDGSNDARFEDGHNAWSHAEPVYYANPSTSWRYTTVAPEGSDSSTRCIEFNTSALDPNYACHRGNCGMYVDTSAALQASSFMVGGWFKITDDPNMMTNYTYSWDPNSLVGFAENGSRFSWSGGYGQVEELDLTDPNIDFRVFSGSPPANGATLTEAVSGATLDVITQDGTQERYQTLFQNCDGCTGTEVGWGLLPRQNLTIRVIRSGGPSGELDSTTTYDDDWHHYVLAVDASQVIRLYIDGVLDCGGGACPTSGAGNEATDGIGIGDLINHGNGEEAYEAFFCDFFFDTNVPSTEAGITTKACRIMLDGYNGRADRNIRAANYGACE